MVKMILRFLRKKKCDCFYENIKYCNVCGKILCNTCFTYWFDNIIICPTCREKEMKEAKKRIQKRIKNNRDESKEENKCI